MDVECCTFVRRDDDDDDNHSNTSNNDDEIEIRIVELNSFGAEMAAASGLFHWVRDEGILYDSTNQMEANSPDEGEGEHDEGQRAICIRVRE